MQINKDIKILWQYLRKYKTKVYFVAFVALVSSAISASIPYIYGHLVDVAVKKSINIKLIFGILGIWLFLTLISNWGERYTDKRGSKIAMATSNNFILNLAGHIMNLPISFHKEKKMGEILQRVGRASDFLRDIIEEAVFSVTPGLLRVIIGLSILTYVEWKLSLTIFVILGAYLIATIFKTKVIIGNQKKLSRAFEKGYGDIYDSTSNVSVVKSSVAEEFEKKRNIKNFKDIARKYWVLMRTWTAMSAWQQTIFGFGFVLIFGLGVFLLRENIITVGELVMFIGYTSLVYAPVNQLARDYRWFKRGMAVIDRALSLFRVKPEDYEEGIKLKDIRGEVVFKNVSFYYKKQQPVLRNLNFKVKSGEAIALVGESGVGKSTLIDLISRYYSPTKGKVLIDDYDIEKVSLKSLRENIAIVPQEISLFNDTIKNNISYGKPGAEDEEIVRVSKAANAHEFIEKFPKKYNQLVGERGIKLSTGQKQRVAIARALIRDPKILILDEATSSLDSVSERLVQQALKRLIKGRTTFVIAHRLSTISHADKILVIEKGKIIETGTHETLIEKKDGLYRKFYLMQSAFREDFKETEIDLTKKE